MNTRHDRNTTRAKTDEFPFTANSTWLILVFPNIKWLILSVRVSTARRDVCRGLSLLYEQLFIYGCLNTQTAGPTTQSRSSTRSVANVSSFSASSTLPIFRCTLARTRNTFASFGRALTACQTPLTHVAIA
eukprot:3910790-Pyramimonas_sp.AAC.2